MSSRNSTRSDFKRIVAMMEEGKIDTRPWITHHCAFDKMISNFPRWLDPNAGVIKAMVEV
jgi:alcohol dehydrogenase